MGNSPFLGTRNRTKLRAGRGTAMALDLKPGFPLHNTIASPGTWKLRQSYAKPRTAQRGSALSQLHTPS